MVWLLDTRLQGRVVRTRKCKSFPRPEGGIEPLRLSAPTGLKPATRTTEYHLDSWAGRQPALLQLLRSTLYTAPHRHSPQLDRCHSLSTRLTRHIQRLRDFAHNHRLACSIAVNTCSKMSTVHLFTALHTVMPENSAENPY